jgi:hypothetical protein
MRHVFGRRLLLVATAALAVLGAVSRPVAAYQIDCAILLCLAGGFPASEPCTRARAVMIRRITPWPIEPPLQLWRCPMRATFLSKPEDAARVEDAAFMLGLPGDILQDNNDRPELWKAFGEDVTDYVMAIKVYDLRYSRWYSSHDGSCNETGRLQVGTYDRDWRFSWRLAPYSASPTWLFSTRHTNCPSVWFRGVGMEWLDQAGAKGTEIVRY